MRSVATGLLRDELLLQHELAHYVSQTFDWPSLYTVATAWRKRRDVMLGAEDTVSS